MLHPPLEGAILVPLDGSVFAEQAVPLAIAIAQATRRRIWLATVQRVLLWPDETKNVETMATMRRLLHAEGENYLRGVQERFHTEGIDLDPVVLPNEAIPVGQELADFVTSAHIGLVVMATHGRGGLSRAWLGSVADDLVRRSTVPVILVRAGTAHLQQGTRILVPLDGSVPAESLIELVCSIAARRHQEITLLQVVAPVITHLGVPESSVVSVDAEMTLAHQHQAQDYIADVEEAVRARGVKCSSLVTIGASAASAILDIAKPGDFGMIAMATHGRGGIRRVMLGSVADKVVRGAEIPVLVWRPTSASPRARQLSTSGAERA